MLESKELTPVAQTNEVRVDDILIYELDERLEFAVVAMDIPPVNGSNCSQNLYKC